jgi:pimeloyl-ACP methyl ester carboxylesterase/peroxiredoxin
VDIFYREAGPNDAPAILLLHAYPSSSFMFRNLIPLLMDKYHVVAPDFPGYGQSSAPPVDKYAYTFANFADVTDKLAGSLGLKAYAIYCGPDVGSYVGFRLAAKHPERITALVIQNGEAYAESRDKEFWHPFEVYGRDRSESNAKHLHKHLSIEDNRWHYTHGARNVEAFSPDTWTLDFAIMSRPGYFANRADLFYDTKSNLEDYAKWQAYFRNHQPPTLVVWGKNSGLVTAEGAAMYKRDLKDVEVHLFDTGHFALEEDLHPIAALIRDFLGRKVASGSATGMIKQEIEALEKDLAGKVPAEQMKSYEEGIELVRLSGVAEKALKVGDKAPDFELPDAAGKPIKLSALLREGPVVVTWYRGAWCPYCNIALRGFQKALPEIKAEGASLVAISPQTPDRTAETVAKGGLGFEVLSDKGNRAARSYGIAYRLPALVVANIKGRLDLDKYNGDSSKELPLSATYVIDRDGVIRYAFVDADYRKRAEPSAIVVALRGLKKAR